MAFSLQLTVPAEKPGVVVDADACRDHDAGEREMVSMRLGFAAKGESPLPPQACARALRNDRQQVDVPDAFENRHERNAPFNVEGA